MYNLVFGSNPAGHAILAMLGLSPGDVGRYRDAFLSKGEIAVYTRNGGGNREDHEEVFEKLRAHPCYLRDADDDFDSTYATIYFSFPEEFREDLEKLDTGEVFEPSKRWLDAIEAIGAAARKDAP